jgi:hypothetical protein
MDPIALVAALQYFSALSIARGIGKLSGQRERMETSNVNEGHGGDEDETEPTRSIACRKLLHGRMRKDTQHGKPRVCRGQSRTCREL